jgi:hypothetical protein
VSYFGGKHSVASSGNLAPQNATQLTNNHISLSLASRHHDGKTFGTSTASTTQTYAKLARHAHTTPGTYYPCFKRSQHSRFLRSDRLDRHGYTTAFCS